MADSTQERFGLRLALIIHSFGGGVAGGGVVYGGPGGWLIAAAGVLIGTFAGVAIQAEAFNGR